MARKQKRRTIIIRGDAEVVVDVTDELPPEEYFKVFFICIMGVYSS